MSIELQRAYLEEIKKEVENLNRRLGMRDLVYKSFLDGNVISTKYFYK